MLTREQFLGYLREALEDLHDPDRLCRSPLAGLFGVANHLDTYSALQHILTDAIAALEPKGKMPPDSRAWRIYDLLSCRYVQELSVPAVAVQLGMSERHVRREQHAALEALADRLWKQFELEKQGREKQGPAGRPAPWASAAELKEELGWLKELPLEHPADLGEALSMVLELARPLAAQHRVHLKATTVAPLPDLAVHPIALTQSLLNLLSVAIHRAAGGQVLIEAKAQRWEVEVQTQCTRSAAQPQPVSNDDAVCLEMARQLAELCGGRLSFAAHEGPFSATLAFPGFEQLPVLAIDDNADALRLFQHYTSGTRYRLVGTQDPEQALILAEKLSPQVIVLDVMMPKVDGWRLLGRLRQHPLTGHIPVVVCTILTQQDLALALGASAFLRKPVTQQAFLAALNGQVARTGSAAH